MAYFSDEKAKREEKKEARRFVIVVSIVSAGIIASGSAIAIHSFLRDGFGIFPVLGIAIVLITLILVVPVLWKILKSGKIPS